MRRSLAVLAALALLVPGVGAAQSYPVIPLSFHDFRPGMTVAEVSTLASRLGGSFSCKPSTRDRRVQECRGRAAGPELGGPVTLWGSAMDGVLGVLTLSGDVAPDQLDAWRDYLEAHHGEVDAKVQGPQWMLQWVRRGTMVRLTWRITRGERHASISLVHGPTLDNWGTAQRQAALPASPTTAQPHPADS
ncbi:MAG: hypothetical protein M3Y31_00470 [Gemmatimonadota bacterium]|nr:hypothetical protein [Gemmatimonadota bacterium]